VLDNAWLSGDHRNLALVGSTDGVPLFDDQRRGAWPFIYRVANAPDYVSQHPSNVHLAMISGNEHLELDEAANCIRRNIRAPKSLHPMLTILADELVGAYRVGVPVVDCTVPVGSPGRSFACRCVAPIVSNMLTYLRLLLTVCQQQSSNFDPLCRVCLLCWCGDYPAQAKVSGTHDKICHWCTYKSQPAPEINRQQWCDFRRYLPADHRFRKDVVRFGSVESRPPSALRTHATFLRDAVSQERYNGPKSKSPYKTTGVKELSPLHHVPLFDLAQDIMGDMMHTIPGYFKRHIVPLLVGGRMPAQPKNRKSWTWEQNQQLSRDHAAAKEHLQSWQLSKVRIC
jgi:hypothetical protein